MLEMMDVEKGKKYQLVATPLKNDITRYVMPDVFECVDLGDDVLDTNIPVFRYHVRADRLIMLHNFTRIVENELIDVLHSVGVPFVDFTTRKVSEGVHDYLELYIELKSREDEAALAKRIDDKLTEVDKDWRDVSAFLKYSPLRVKLLPKGSFNRYLASQTGMPRVERIGMSDERFERLSKQS
jgi:hypothetical protein